MATFNSDLVTKQAAALLKSSSGVRDGDDFSGSVKLATAHVTLTGSTAADDIINIIPAELVPVGAVVVPQLCTVTSADPGTTLTLDIGDAANTDRYADGIVLNAGGIINFCSGTKPESVATPYRIPEQAAIYATVMTADTVTNGTVLTFVIAYRSKS
jgi:hypothetical protein